MLQVILEHLLVQIHKSSVKILNLLAVLEVVWEKVPVMLIQELVHVKLDTVALTVEQEYFDFY